MGHGTNTRGTEGKAGVGADEEGPGRLARFASGFASGVSSVNQQQPSAIGGSVNAATQIATSMLNRQRDGEDAHEEAPTGKNGQKLPAWYILQRQQEEMEKIRAAQQMPRPVPAL